MARRSSSVHRHRWSPWRYSLGHRYVRSCKGCPLTEERAA